MRNILMILVMIVCSSCDINNQKLLLVNKTSNPIYYRLLKFRTYKDVDNIMN